jgi:L-alanine-DL-glutamate epimerase-like enolase superfamily enzyme
VHTLQVKIPLIDRKVDMHARGGRQTFVFCEVETDTGLVGYGVTSHELSESVATALNVNFLPIVKDLDPRDVERVHYAVWKSLNQKRNTGVVIEALSCLDIALWDIHGKHTGRTVAQLLGGYATSMPAYCTFGPSIYDRDQLVEAAKIQVRAGFKALKMVVYTSHGDWREDARRVRAVRDAIGDDIDLMVDGNAMFSFAEASNLCREIKECNLMWFEEPVHNNDTRALAELRRAFGIPLAAGQQEGERFRFVEFIQNQSLDVLQPSCIHIGGFTEQRKVAHLAQAFNMKVANGGGWPHLNIHGFAGVMNGWILEWHLGMIGIAQAIFTGTTSPKDGVLAVPEAPGLGYGINRDVLNDSCIAL